MMKIFHCNSGFVRKYLLAAAHNELLSSSGRQMSDLRPPCPGRFSRLEISLGDPEKIYRSNKICRLIFD